MEKNEKQKSKYILEPMEISILCTQLSMNLKAGVPLYDGIAAVSEDAENKKIKAVIDTMNEALYDRKSLSAAIKQTDAFPQYVTSMIEIGEASGMLEEVTTGLSEYYMREKAMKDRIRSAVIYPFMLFVMLSAVTILLVTKILPVFQDIFVQLGGDASAASSNMMSMGMAGGAISLFLVAFIILLLIIYVILSKTQKGMAWGQKLFVQMPLTRGLASKMIAEKFASAMYLMLSSGATTEDALNMTKAVIGNPFVEKKIEDCRQKLMEGQNFVQSLLELGLFPSMFLRLVEIGTKTGYLSDTMKKLSIIYEEEADTSLGNLTAYIEPCLVGILALIIGGVLISVMLPLAGVMSSIG